MIHEIRIRREYSIDAMNHITIHWVLADTFAVWMNVYRHEGRKRFRFIVRLDPEDVIITGGWVIIEADDLMGFFMKGYVLGTRYEIMQPKYYDHEQSQSKAQ